MRNKIICFINIILFSSVCAFAKSNVANNHLAKLNGKFPYVLLGDDYGILSINDLATNVCGVESIPFNRDREDYHPSLYWQCFESKTISFNCDSNGIPDKHEGVMGLIVMKASINHIKHEYIERRLWPIKDCKGFLKDANALLKGIQYACISGSFIGKETDQSGHQSTSWIFERIKTKKGCEGHDCQFTKKFKQDNCPNMKL